jgi:hypothetical protein
MVGSPEQQKAESERQAQAMAAHSRARMTEAERLVGRGALLEQTARGNLEQSFGVKGKEEERRLAKSQLAESLAMQGRYAEAAEVHPDKEQRKYYRDIAVAIEKPDDEKCDCGDRRAKMNDTELSITPRFERARIFSPVHNDVVSLVECSKCGHWNARPLRSRLLKHNDALAMSEGAKKPVLSDPQVLNR